ncbi:MAG: Holliday junction resolvase RuvX [Acidobacteriota bacterium]|nr:Holliday junction resolvase RuvX [Acidobacteriota bacterium]MDE3043379.1 Holliday junction resolvase RuvX [Acidobacteriota bacterium]MDE3107579.1 Holliday junction resolvase RuvX [Acidobacteriota bacterium]MDE3222122.1 Holliday junction resolvase RuvX [Acidobacteriota bacterium]
MARLLGLDPGTRRCGVAVSNSARTMAFPREALANDDQLITRLRAVVEEEFISAIVVGRPVALSGRETDSTASADRLYEALRDAFDGIDVVQWDERLTTHEAQRALSQAGVRAKSQRAHVDSAAATILLQNYLDGLIGD